MSHKGMSHTMVVIVTAVVILILALVILTIFVGVFDRYSTIADARNSCELTGRQTCSTAGSLPFDWEFNFKAGGEDTSCSRLRNNCKTCTDCGFT